MTLPRGFSAPNLSDGDVEKLRDLGRLCRGDILHMTTLAESGHPGGSMSSLEFYLVVYSCANLFPTEPKRPDRDLVVVSHGHTSPGVYSALGRNGFFPIEDAVAWFRLLGSPYEGHVEHGVPGVEWSSGNLGQGLSAACGFALAQRLRNRPGRVWCLMSDGEQAKGQVAEARRFATKYKLNNITVVIDYNRLQISGDLACVMPQDIPASYKADGWDVAEVDGHDVRALYAALRKAKEDTNRRWAIVARTVMGKGVSFMENKHGYHGKPLNEEELKKALAELKLPFELDKYRAKRAAFQPGVHAHCPIETDFKVEAAPPRTYELADKTDNRTAFGKAVLDVALANKKAGGSPVAALDCDLATSVKTSYLEEKLPEAFFQAGVQEHNAAVIAGALSARGVIAFFADFGVFGVDETYNQHRLTDINWGNVKIACTHCGMDVGEDGKTHQCVDYIGLLRNLPGFKAVVPADANQTDRVIRAIAGQPGNWFVGMGRSRFPVIDDGAGKPLFAGAYRFEYGKVDRVRAGKQATILAYGSTLARALTARTLLSGEGIDAAVWNVSCPKDPDPEAVLEAARTGPIVTYEDHFADTGLGGVVACILANAGMPCSFRAVGVRGYGASGKPDALFKEAGIAPEHAAKAVKELLR